MYLKLFFFFVLLVNLGLPANTVLDLILIFFCIIILFFSKNIKISKIIRGKYIYFILIISFINFFIPKYFFNEGHSVFLTKNDLIIMNQFLPKEISANIEKKFLTEFEFDRLTNASDWGEGVHNRNFIKEPFAFSTDNIFLKSKMSRYNSEINFKTREDIRIGQINSLNFNWPFDTQLRRELPYYIFFEIPKIFSNSKICHKGDLYYHLSDKKINISKIKELQFIKFTSETCQNFNKKNKFIYLIGYSISKKSNLEIKFTNNKLVLFKLAKYLITLIYLFLIFKLYRVRLKNTYIYICSILSTLLLVFIRDINVFLGLRYFRGGADGIAHYSWGRDILKNFSEYNFIESLRGGEDVYYYMPGLRYFGSINNLIFGETLFGYIIICTFIPLVFFKIFELLFSKKIAYIFFLSFIFFPILENMGLGYFNFIWNLARFHAEPLSIFLFLLSLYLIIKINFYNINNKKNKYIYFVGLLFALSIFLRPNYFPASLIIFSYFLLLVFRNGSYKILFINLLGYSFLFVCLLHNIYFGNETFLFTRSIVNFKLDIIEFFTALYSIFIMDYDNESLKVLISQFKIWNPLYNLHRLIMILYILFIFIKIKQPAFNYVLFISVFCQHGLLILTHPGGRYSYFAWILTFLLFSLIFFKPKKDNLKYVT